MDRVKLQLAGLNGNAFNLLGAFQSAAREQGWSRPQIQSVFAEATASNYEHLLHTLASYTEEPEESDPE